MTDTPNDEPSARMVSWAKNSSLYRLGQKMMSEHELFEALRKKALSKFDGISDALAADIAGVGIKFCNEHRFLDDSSYANVKTASAIRSGRSKRRIAMDLANKGIDTDLIQQSLLEVDDTTSAVIFARKRAFGPFRRVALDDKRKNKEFSAMARNGYSSSLAMKVINMTIDEAEEALSA